MFRLRHRKDLPSLKSTHSGRLERWLGSEEVLQISDSMRSFYWPIAVHGVPGSVYAMPGGGFGGEIRAGSEVSAVERALSTLRLQSRQRFARNAMLRHQLGSFASLSAIVTAQTGGKGQQFLFKKTGVAVNAIANAEDLWAAAGQPAAGAAGGAAPGGTVPTNATTGSFGYVNPANANTGHYVGGWNFGTSVSNTLLLYDRLFMVAKTMNSTATEAVTGVPTRYQNQSAGNDFIGGNFCFPSNPTTVLPATAHNWTVGQYTDQGGNTAQSFPSIAGVSSCVVLGIDLAVGNWFMPLAAGDTGVKALTQMQCSALVATGTIDFVVGHPIAFMPCPVVNVMCLSDGIVTAFNLQTIFDNSCLAFLEMPKPATTACSYTGQINVVAE